MAACNWVLLRPGSLSRKKSVSVRHQLSSLFTIRIDLVVLMGQQLQATVVLKIWHAGKSITGASTCTPRGMTTRNNQLKSRWSFRNLRYVHQLGVHSWLGIRGQWMNSWKDTPSYGNICCLIWAPATVLRRLELPKVASCAFSGLPYNEFRVNLSDIDSKWCWYFPFVVVLNGIFVTVAYVDVLADETKTWEYQ